MPANRPDKAALLRLLDKTPAYPAVFLPTPEGGFEVIFPNLPDLRAYGVTLGAAEKAAREILTHTLTGLFLEGAEPPRASDPERLHPDPDEPQGTRLIMVQPDKAVIRKRLGLERQEKGGALKSLGVYGR